MQIEVFIVLGPCAFMQAGLKIVVDAGNGAGGFFATEVWQAQHHEMSIPVFYEMSSQCMKDVF